MSRKCLRHRLIHHPNHGAWKEELDPLERPGMLAQSTVYSSLLRSCGSGKAVSDEKRVHNLIVQNGHDQNVFLGSLLVEMYAKCEALEDAFVLFFNLHQRNVFVSNIIIKALARQGNSRDALEIFWRMQEEGILPDRITFICLLSVCANQLVQVEGKHMHSRIMSSSFWSDVVVATAVVNMYGRCGSLKEAQNIFNKIRVRDVISWNVIMTLYVQHGQVMEALKSFEQMQREGILPDKAQKDALESGLVSVQDIEMIAADNTGSEQQAFQAVRKEKVGFHMKKQAKLRLKKSGKGKQMVADIERASDEDAMIQ